MIPETVDLVIKKKLHWILFGFPAIQRNSKVFHNLLVIILCLNNFNRSITLNIYIVNPSLQQPQHTENTLLVVRISIKIIMSGFHINNNWY